MATVLTSRFLGLNRLPLGEEGEGIEFKNLSLDFYPVASTGGFLQTDEDIYIKGEEDTPIDFSLLQGVGEIKADGERLYLTGVYNGKFYLNGKECSYFGAGERITENDKVSIEKIGKEWVILAVKGKKSVIWSISEVEKRGKNNEEREKDGKLISDMLRLKLPEYGFDGLWLHQVSDGDAYRQRSNYISRQTGIGYYCLYMSLSRLYHNYVLFKGYEQYRKLDIYEEYNGMQGAYMYLTSPHNDFDPEKYCFDDQDSEHPTRFVIDAASRGVDNLLDRLDSNERAEYRDGRAWDDEYEGVVEELKPYGVNQDGTIFSAPVRKIDLQYDVKRHYCFPMDISQGIIGHFEIWNEETGGYEPKNTELIYRRVNLETGEELRAANTAINSHFYGNKEWAGYDIDRMTNTLIRISATGIFTEAMRLSHITEYMGRLYATVSDGSMFVASEMGSLTDFSEYQGIASDSGYFESLTSGKFTGICEYSGGLVVFKEESFCIYYGDTPSTLSLSREIKTVGCISSDSICEVNGILFFLSRDGFCAYSGGVVENISRKLGEKITSAKSFCVGRKYYAVCENATYIYDTDVGCWSVSERLDLKCKVGERLICSDGIRRVADYNEWTGEWIFESMNLFEGITEDKGINKLYIRARLTGDMTVKTISDEETVIHQTITDTGEVVKIFTVPVRLLHKNYYRIRLEGEGKCVLYAIEREIYAGGKKR